jgi:hypothetical protein
MGVLPNINKGGLSTMQCFIAWPLQVSSHLSSLLHGSKAREHNDKMLASVSEIKLSRAQLVPGWVTVQEYQATEANSTFHPSGVGE